MSATTAIEYVLVLDAERSTSAVSAYLVRVEGQTLGIVERKKVTLERRTPGKRYVDKRWQSLRWFARPIPGSSGSRLGFESIDFTTRAKAASRLLGAREESEPSIRGS